MTRTPIAHRRNGKGRGGRPKSDDLEKLNSNILVAAGELFLQYGYDGTSMDAIAEKARISKRTLYSRHTGKFTLFNAAMYDLLGRLLIPLERFQYDASGELEPVLRALAGSLVQSALTPEFLAVHRVITFESQRRPEFGRWINDARRKPAIQVIASILRRYGDELRVTDFEAAAEHFSHLTFDSCLRLASLGIKFSPREISERVDATVDLFLSGIRRREPQRSASHLPASIDQ